MNFAQTLPPTETRLKNRNLGWLWVSGLATLTFAVAEFVTLWLGGHFQIWVVLPMFVAALIFLWLIGIHRELAAGILLIAAIGLQSLLTPLIVSGLGLPNSITSFVLISGIGLAALPRRQIGRALIVGLMILIASALIDLFGSPTRPLASFVQAHWNFTLVISILFTVFFAREFLLLNLRTKIVTAILATGGIALAILISIASYEIGQTIASLTARLDTSVSQLAEAQLKNTALVEANRANQEFQAIAEEAVGLAQTWLSLRSQDEALTKTPYWDARAKLIQLEGGQYGNKATDISSVFIPVNTPIDDALLADLNVSAYLDFSAPAILQERPLLLALYAIDTRGVTRYYPNIDLASVVPPDFDTTQRPYFKVASPLFNPKRLPRWTIPYVDATGGGLVVTVAAPVYEGNDFIGVVAADMQLSHITEQIGSIPVGKTGYAFMIDDAGRPLAMPKAGLDMFGVRPEEMQSDEFFKQTLLGEGTVELQALTKRMTSGAHGLLTVNVNGVDTYISFYPIHTNGYSVALVVPVSEMQNAIVEARNETQQQFQSTIRLAATLIIFLLIFAIPEGPDY